MRIYEVRRVNHANWDFVLARDESGDAWFFVCLDLRAPLWRVVEMGTNPGQWEDFSEAWHTMLNIKCLNISLISRYSDNYTLLPMPRPTAEQLDREVEIQTCLGLDPSA